MFWFLTNTKFLVLYLGFEIVGGLLNFKLHIFPLKTIYVFNISNLRLLDCRIKQHNIFVSLTWKLSLQYIYVCLYRPMVVIRSFEDIMLLYCSIIIVVAIAQMQLHMSTSHPFLKILILGSVSFYMFRK